MDAFESARTVLAVRSYAKKPVPHEIIRRIVEAGRLTGSGSNHQPWHFVVVDNPDALNELGRLAPTGPYIAQAALAVVVAIEKTEYSVSDASRAIQSMIMTAWSEGVASNWVGFLGLEKANTFLDIPSTLDVLAILPFGYPADATLKGKKKRKAFSELVHHGRFGQPFV